MLLRTPSAKVFGVGREQARPSCCGEGALETMRSLCSSIKFFKIF
jgi:hypothetical protein